MKKGQVTLFIIIGIVLLFTVGIFVFIQQSRDYVNPDLIEPELAPINNYVKECIALTTEDAVGLLGLQGGYIEIPEEIGWEKYAYIKVDRDGLFKIPLWYHNSLSRIPSVEFMENEISNYFNNNIGECLRDFAAFENTFEIKELKKIKTKTTIQQDNVFVEIDYPLKINDKGRRKVSYIREFSEAVPVRLKEAYDLAVKIMQQENKDMYFEDVTMELMTMNDDIPFDGMEFTCKQKKWYLRDIKKNIQEMLYYNIPSIRVENTDYLDFIAEESVYEKLKETTLEDITEGKYPRIEAPDDIYEYNHFLWDVKTKKTDLIAAFSYMPEFGMNIYARPSEKGILKSGVGKGAEQMKFMCMNFYHFTYDLWYPIEVMIRDDTAFSFKGFVFRFGFPVLIDHNEGKRVDFGTSLFNVIIPDYNEECTDLAGQIYDIRALGSVEGLLGVEIGDANITYNCYRFSCLLGQTKADQGIYRLRTQLPSNCGHGILEATKDGYVVGKTQVLDDDYITIQMKKLKEYDFKVVKHRYFDGVISEEEEIANYSSALINLENDDVVNYKQYPDAENKIELIEDDSSYDLEIILIDEVDDLTIGGYNGEWSISFNEMYGKDTVIFHVIEYLPKPFDDNSTYEMLKFLEENQDYKTQLRPEFK